MPIVAVIPEPNSPVELRDVAEPDLESNSALLEVELSEVCGTDVHLQRGRLAGVPYPLVPGHVSVGRLQKIRGELLDIYGKPFSEGDRITFLDVHRTCNACWYCLVAKASTRCPQRKVYGITYGLDDGLCGGWATHIYLKPGTRCIRLSAEPETFMAGGCALPTALHAIERGEIKIGDSVLVLGLRAGRRKRNYVGRSAARRVTRTLHRRAGNATRGGERSRRRGDVEHRDS
jgi:L-iditol 2-dehydrogenase